MSVLPGLPTISQGHVEMEDPGHPSRPSVFTGELRLIASIQKRVICICSSSAWHSCFDIDIGVSLLLCWGLYSHPECEQYHCHYTWTHSLFEYMSEHALRTYPYTLCGHMPVQDQCESCLNTLCVDTCLYRLWVHICLYIFCIFVCANNMSVHTQFGYMFVCVGGWENVSIPLHTYHEQRTVYTVNSLRVNSVRVSPLLYSLSVSRASHC